MFILLLISLWMSFIFATITPRFLNFSNDNFSITIICIFCIFGLKGTSTSKVIGARNEMTTDDDDCQMIFGDLVGLMLPDICLTGEEKPQKKPHPGNCPNRGSNLGPLHNKRACYHLSHSGGHYNLILYYILLARYDHIFSLFRIYL